MEILNTTGRLLSIFSIIILFLGILITVKKNYPDKNWILAYLSCLLSMEGLAFFIMVYLNGNVLFIFILSFFIQFSFLTHFYCSTIFQISLTKRNAILCLGLLPFLIYVLPPPYNSFFQHYDRIPYSIAIMLYSLMYFYALINGSISTIHSKNILNGTILLFFTLDTFLAIGTKYLVTENLLLVAWFWFIRALFLQAFYIALIYYGWKSSEEIEQQLDS